MPRHRRCRVPVLERCGAIYPAKSAAGRSLQSAGRGRWQWLLILLSSCPNMAAAMLGTDIRRRAAVHPPTHPPRSFNSVRMLSCCSGTGAVTCHQQVGRGMDSHRQCLSRSAAAPLLTLTCVTLAAEHPVPCARRVVPQQQRWLWVLVCTFPSPPCWPQQRMVHTRRSCCGHTLTASDCVQQVQGVRGDPTHTEL